MPQKTHPSHSLKNAASFEDIAHHTIISTDDLWLLSDKKNKYVDVVDVVDVGCIDFVKDTKKYFVVVNCHPNRTLAYLRPVWLWSNLWKLVCFLQPASKGLTKKQS